ncbi:capsular polysaccharide biosynthesis protein [Cupriavidus sp. H39]|uniref:capsular polysaccharide export protein, LipB/KpsS family n=1 Tax=Cupriavidus sp. H39 TaxID=3401635 RepID=UPI003D0333FA
MVKRALIADQLHIQSKNFPSLLEYLKQAQFEMLVVSHPAHLIAAFGDYSNSEEVVPYREALNSLTSDEVFSLTEAGVSCFSLCKAEMLCFLAPTDFWVGRTDYGRTERELFDLAWRENRDVLLNNVAAVGFWFDRWRSILQEKPVFDFAFLFSGSLIYARVLSVLMKRRQGMLYICESFFTGKDYYLEARHSPLPNNSALRSNGVYKSLDVPTSGPARRGRRAALGLRLAEMANKNVKQPTATGKRLFHVGAKVVAIFGQVLNDFSLLNNGEVGFHSVNFYTECIHKIITETDAYVVFKAHPWEQKKAHIRSALTKEHLIKMFGENDRLKIVEDYPIADLIREADFVVGINSQSLIEAAVGGVKPIQCGKAFYAGKGFTHDVKDVDDVVDLIKALPGSYLTIDEYFYLETFLLKALDEWLIPESPALGVPRLERRLGAIKKVAATKPLPATQKSPVVKSVANIVVSKIAIEPTRTATSNLTQRKLKKLRNDPKAFFRDAKNPLIRSIAKIL